MQLEQVENCAVMGAAAIIIAPPDGDSMFSTAQSVMSKGIYVTYMGLTPAEYDVSGGSNVDWVTMGKKLGAMVSAWVDTRYPEAAEGEMHVAYLGVADNVEIMRTNDNFEETLAGDKRCELVYTFDGAGKTDEAFDAAEGAFTYDPDIRIVAAYQDQLAVGVNNYIMAQQGIDLAEYGVFACGTTEAGLALIEQAKTEGSVYRGTLAYGPDRAGEKHFADGIITVTWALLNGEAEAPYWNFDDIWSVNSFGLEL